MTTATITATEPLRETIDRLIALYPDAPIQVGAPAGPGWVPVSELFAPNSTRLPTMLAAATATYQTPHRDVAASFLFHRYNWMVTCVTIGAYLIDRRLPDLAPANVAIHIDDQGQGDRIALRSGRFWTTAEDAAARHPEALIDPAGVIDPARVRSELERHFEPVIDVVRANAPFGKRAMWLSLADNAAWCLVEFGRLLHRPDGRGAEIEALLQAPGSRMRGGTRLITIEAAGRVHEFVGRGSCCLSYKLPETDYCATCPLLKPEQQFDRLYRHAVSGA